VLLEHHLVLLAHESFLSWLGVFQIRARRLLVELLEHKLLTFLSKRLFSTQLGVWQTLVENHVKIEMVSIEELNCVRIRVKAGLLRHIIVKDMSLANYRSGIYRNIEWSSNIFLLDITPVISGQSSLNNSEFLNSSLILNIFVIESIELVWFILHDQLAARKLGIKGKEFAVLY